jgi:NhaP-type Na+/H+ or K+/H+ antiporter
VWGGLRGAVSLALVLSLPASFADRELLKVMAYGVVLFTLLGQGTTMQWLLKRLGLIQQDEVTLEHERSYGRLLVARAGQARVAELHQAGIISSEAWQELAPQLNREVQAQTQARQKLLELKPELKLVEQENARLETLRAKRATLTILYSNGVISEAVYEELLAEIDADLQKEGENKPAQEGEAKI